MILDRIETCSLELTIDNGSMTRETGHVDFFLYDNKKREKRKEKEREMQFLCGLFKAHRFVVIALVIVVGFNKV